VSDIFIIEFVIIVCDTTKNTTAIHNKVKNRLSSQ